MCLKSKVQLQEFAGGGSGDNNVSILSYGQLQDNIPHAVGTRTIVHQDS